MIYFKIFDIDSYDTEYQPPITSGDIPTGNLDEGYVYQFHGNIDVTTKEQYLYEQQHPYEIEKFFRDGKHYIDTLKISIIATPQVYENLCFASLRNDAILIGWNTANGFQYRWIKSILPHPVKTYKTADKIDFNIDTAHYTSINRNMRPDFLKNFRFNFSTIENTVFN